MVGFRKRAAVLISVSGLLAGLLAGAFYSLLYDLPEINQLKQFKPSSVTRVYDSGDRIIARFYLEKRFPVTIDAMPAHLIDALIVTEDRHFFTHSGVNLKAILRALIHDLRAGSFKQGASTLTQQLAKTLFLSPEKSIVRKIREALLAVQIERRYTKDEILELYLNLIYLGSGTYGVEAASRTYFNTSVSGLTLGQAALIAGLPKAPSVYSPLKNPELARRRRAIVLGQMLDTGKISQAAHDAADAEPVTLASAVTPEVLAPFFVAYLKHQLQNMNTLPPYASGLSIHTTLDMELQKTAERSVSRHLNQLEKRMQKNGIQDPRPEAAVIALDVRTGAIRAMVGGRDFTTSKFNRAVQAMRQPGSAFKPLVYAAAIEAGYDQTTPILDAPLSYPLPGNRIWEVKNFSRTFKGEMTFRQALALSQNAPVVRLGEMLGLETVVAFARKAGIQSPLKPYPSMTLGSWELTLLELTSAYTPFANRGDRAGPFAVEKILDQEGHSLFQHRIQKQAVTDRRTAAIMADMLGAVIREGTGKKADRIKTEIAGKTGTTNEYKDALFVGFSPDLACGVWVGNDDATTLGPYETGARAALPVWIDCMEDFLARQSLEYFDIPDGVTMVYVRPDSGKRTSGPGPGRVRAMVRTD